MATQLPDGVRLLRTLTVDGLIGHISWSPDGRMLMTLSLDAVRIWDAASGGCLRTIRSENVLAAAFDPDGCILATAGIPGTTLWDVESGELRTTLDRGIGTAVAFSPRHRILATANDGFGITLWELSTGAVLHRLAGSTGVVAFDAEGGMLATVGFAGTIRLWEIPGGGYSESSTGTRRRSLLPPSIRVARFWPRASVALSGCGTWQLATPSRFSRAMPAR